MYMLRNDSYAGMVRGEWIMSSLLEGEIHLQKATQHSLSLPAKTGSSELDVTAENCQRVTGKEGYNVRVGPLLQLPLALCDRSFLINLFGEGWFWTCSQGESRFTGAPQRENDMDLLGKK